MNFEEEPIISYPKIKKKRTLITNIDVTVTKQNLVFEPFIPIKGLFYIYFTKKGKPKERKLNYSYNQIFGIFKVSDIKRFCYYPDTTNLFTFLGFRKNRLNSLNQ